MDRNFVEINFEFTMKIKSNASLKDMELSVLNPPAAAIGNFISFRDVLDFTFCIWWETLASCKCSFETFLLKNFKIFVNMIDRIPIYPWNPLESATTFVCLPIRHHHTSVTFSGHTRSRVKIINFPKIFKFSKKF